MIVFSSTIAAASTSSASNSVHGKFNASVGSGMTAGSVILEKQYPDSTNWFTVHAFTGSGSIQVEEVEGDVVYRFTSDSSFAGSVLVRVGDID